MTLKIEGTYKSKTYINLWIIKIQTGWKTVPFSWSQVLPDKGLNVPIKGTPLMVAVSLTGLTVDFWLSFDGIPLIGQSLSLIRTGKPLTFHSEPIKGVIVEGTASLS